MSPVGHIPRGAIYVNISSMRLLVTTIVIALYGTIILAQSPAKTIYDTERAFERMVAEQGLNAGFIEYLSVDGVMFFPEAANARQTYRARPKSPAALTWNPILVCVSSNGALAYSIGNSIYRPKGRDDPTGYAGHYLSVWMKQPDGQYRAVLDAGINHETPASVPTDWKDTGSAAEPNPQHAGAADSSVGFYQTAESKGLAAAYGSYLADDAIVMRDENQPFVGKKAALGLLKNDKAAVKFTKRRSFVEAGELAYVYGPYSRLSKDGGETEKGNFIQVWRLRGGKWQIVADMTVVIPKPKT